MLASLLRLLRHEYPGAGLCVISFNPHLTKEIHGVPSVSTHTPDVLEALRDADTVILGPGGIFHDARPPESRTHQSGVSFYGALASETIATGRTMAAIGVSLGPLTTPTARRIASEISATADPLVLRDAVSSNGRGIVAPDLGWLGDPVEASHADRTATLAVAARSWGAPAESNAVAMSISAALDALIEDGVFSDIVFVAMEEGRGASDATYARQVMELMLHRDHSSVRVPATVEEAQDALGSVDVVLAMRFHGVLLAAAAGVPTVAVAYAEKVSSLMAELKQPDRCLGIDAAPLGIVAAVKAAAEAEDTGKAHVTRLRAAADSSYHSAIAAIPQPNLPVGAPSRIRFDRKRYGDALRIRMGR